MFAKGWNDNRKQGKEWAKEHIAHYWAETYHKPTDQTHPDTDDYSGLLQEVQLFFDLGYKLAQDTGYPKWKPKSEFANVLKDKLSEIDDANISKYKYFRDRYSGRNAVKQSINNMVNENITSLLEQEAEVVRNIPVTPGYEEAVSLIVKHVHDLGGKLIMSGMGKAGQIALNIATTFSSTGTPAFSYIPARHNTEIWESYARTISCY